MAVVVIVAGAFVWTQAGKWGVPYFSFVDQNGSQCTNEFLGHRCEPITLDHVRAVSNFEWPPSVSLVSGSYTQFQEYNLEARLRAPKSEVKDLTKAIDRRFGKCVKNRPTNLPTDELKKVCVRSNDGSLASGNGPANQTYVVATGVEKDGTLLVDVNVRPR